MNCPGFLQSINPRLGGCARCGRLPDRHHLVAVPAAPTDHPRDKPLEQRILALASEAGGHQGDHGLWSYANHRAFPGGIRANLDSDQEAREELADCANYLTWGLVRDYEAYEQGQPEATDRFERRLRTLKHVVDAWYDLHTGAH